MDSTPQTFVSNLNLLSYNPTGWGDVKVDFINSLLLIHGVHICAVQEHFQLKNNTYRVTQSFPGYNVFSLPAFKSDLSIHAGRPVGGLALIYSSRMGKYVTQIKVPHSSRVQGLKLKNGDASFIFINAYFPVDTRKRNADNHELLQTLHDIKYITDSSDEGSVIVLMGDMNSDFSRHSQFVDLVRNFLDDANLVTAWTKFPCDFTFSHSRNIDGQIISSKSTIDHFCISKNNIADCEDAFPMHLVDNLSGHNPILLKINCENLKMDSLCTLEPSHHESKPLWFRATSAQIDKYKLDLRDAIHNITVPHDAVYCRNVHCSAHKSSLDEVAEEVLGAISDSVKKNIPYSNTQARTPQPVPGWKEEVQPYKEKAEFWHSIWLQDQKREGTQLHKVMKYTRGQYRYAVRRTKRKVASIRKDKYVQACLDGKITDILTDIKQARSKNKACATSIDGKTDCGDIAEHFKQIYSDIYNTHQDKSELESFIEANNNSIKQEDINILDKITPNLVKDTINKFKNNKNDSEVDWKSDALKIGVEYLAEPLCDLLKAFITHGYIPKVFLSIVLIPIVKDNKSSKLTSTNYRLIAISALLLKLFDSILLELYQDRLHPSSYQFGFQKGLSTTMCSWAVLETVNFFRNRESPVFMCLLDLSKAFDLVKLPVLFSKLSDKIPPLLIRFIIFSYVEQQCVVKWQGHISTAFGIGNGVRQGAVASPPFFSLYIDKLFTLLRESRWGCYINSIFHGAYAYADDVTLLSPTREGLVVMLLICDLFFKELGITISTNPDPVKSKTKVMVFGGINSVPLSLYNRDIPVVSQAKHLGHIFHADETMEHDLKQKTNEIRAGYFTLLQELGDQSPFVFLRLLRIYIIHLYGSPLWDIFDESSNTLWTAWHRMVKQLFNLPLATHRFIVAAVSQTEHIQLTVIKRFLKFHDKLNSSKNQLIQNLLKAQSRDNRSTFGRNCNNIRRLSDQRVINFFTHKELNIHRVPESEEWRVPVVLDVLQSIKDYSVVRLNLDLIELQEILNSVCCK